MKALLEMTASALLILGWFTLVTGVYFIVVSFAGGGIILAMSIALLGALCLFTAKQIEKYLLTR